ncbi:sulfonate dioxygenase [Martiniozyma asiatica (nom. inval.)]|nr:sulfonate dioxygenase [Martiniozyma asiatica]
MPTAITTPPADFANLPIDQQVEFLIRNTDGVNITRSSGTTAKLFVGKDPLGAKLLPANSRKRLEDGYINVDEGYPEIPDRSKVPVFVDQAYAVRDEDVPYIERGKNADPEKKALFTAAKEVVNLTDKIGTEIVGLQLGDLDNQQLDELALLIAERGVVFFRDQKLSPKKQWEIGDYYGNIEKHPQAPHVPGLPGLTVIWYDILVKRGMDLNFANANLPNWDKKYPATGSQIWHTDLVHERQPAGYTHLHIDEVPEVGGDTIWSSGLAAYDKLSDALKSFLDGKEAIYVSTHNYLDRNDPFGNSVKVERTHPLVRTHPATGWKYLFVNRAMTKRIIGLSPVESDLILNYLFDVYEKNADIQVRFNWKSKPGFGTSAIWDNRFTQHRNVWDTEGKVARHGTRVTSLAEKPYFDPASKSQRESLGLPIHKWD